MSQENKVCRKCQISKPLENYYAHKNSSKIYSACKECCAKANKAWRCSNVDKLKLRNKQRGARWTSEAREKYAVSERDKHDSYLWRYYGITIDQYDKMLKEQGGVCAICKQECNRQNSKRFCVDHEHSTGLVRGLLCFQCNVGLGKFKDDASLLVAAVNYLNNRRSDKKAA